jgi:rRNA maturation endonuclease Nob1
MENKSEEKFELVCDDCGKAFSGNATGEVCPDCGSDDIYIGEYNWE